MIEMGISMGGEAVWVFLLTLGHFVVEFQVRIIQYLSCKLEMRPVFNFVLVSGM